MSRSKTSSDVSLCTSQLKNSAGFESIVLGPACGFVMDSDVCISQLENSTGVASVELGPACGFDMGADVCTIDLLINWSTSELNTLLDPTTYLDYTDCWIQLVTAPTMAVTSWIQLSTCILPSTCTRGRCPPLSN